MAGVRLASTVAATARKVRTEERRVPRWATVTALGEVDDGPPDEYVAWSVDTSFHYTAGSGTTAAPIYYGPNPDLPRWHNLRFTPTSVADFRFVVYGVAGPDVTVASHYTKAGQFGRSYARIHCAASAITGFTWRHSLPYGASGGFRLIVQIKSERHVYAP